MKALNPERVPYSHYPVVLITGDGRSLLSDLEDFSILSIPHDVMAIGRSINKYPGDVLHWANVDGADSKWWAEHLPGKPVRHTIGKADGYDVFWDDEKVDFMPFYGSTALFAVLICLEMGYERIFLAGCPLDKLGHWFNESDTGPDWRPEDYQAWIDFAKTPSAKKVISLSGETKRILDESHNFQ